MNCKFVMIQPKNGFLKKDPILTRGLSSFFLADFEFHDLLKVYSSSSVLFTLKIIK